MFISLKPNLAQDTLTLLRVVVLLVFGKVAFEKISRLGERSRSRDRSEAAALTYWVDRFVCQSSLCQSL